MRKWWKSLTVRGTAATVLGVLLHPSVFAVLPGKVATTISVLGGAAAVIGLRRAVGPAPADSSPPRAGDWENTFDAQGLNPYGETRDDVARRREAVDATADDNRAFLMGQHYTPKPPLG